MSKRRSWHSLLKKRNQRLNKKQAKADQLNVEKLEEKMLLAVGPQLIGIQPNEGALLINGQTLNVGPTDLTFRFDQNQLIDPTSLSGIQITRAGLDGQIGDGNDMIIQPGFIGVGETPNENEVVLRFAEPLPDDVYQIDIFGSGANVLRNAEGDAFNDGINRSIRYELDLGAQVVAVVPQPTSTDGNRTQARNQIEVFFNDDDLLTSSAQNPEFYQLIFTNDTIENTDDVIHNPVSVSYDAGTDKAVLTFASDLEDLSSGPGTYRLRIGTDETTPAAPVEVLPDEDVGSSYDTAYDLGELSRQSQVISGAIDPFGFPLDYPGSIQEPGMLELANLPNIPADAEDGVTSFIYNFDEIYGEDASGNPLFNLITENQKDRAREVFEIWSNYAGIMFVEAEGEGVTIATGDPAAVTQDPTVILDGSVFWSDTIGQPANPLAQSWFEAALREVGTTMIGIVDIQVPPPNLFLEDPLLSPNNPIEPIYPGNQDIIQAQHGHRPEGNDIDIYRFELPVPGVVTAETVAERLPETASPLDTILSLYRESDGERELIARNDDYFSEDSFLNLGLQAGVYYVAVSSVGNDNFDPIFEDNGANGRTEGDYQLRINYRPAVDNFLIDSTGIAFDGDADGNPGGVYNFWTHLVSESDTIYVDKSASGGDGTLASPYSSIPEAIARVNQIRNAGGADAERRLVIRLLGNGGTDGNYATLTDNLPYEIGSNGLQGTFQDGANFDVPRGVTAIIDEGAIFKMFQSTINVGSAAVTVDRSDGAIQVLGTPENTVYFTSFDDELIGQDGNPLPSEPEAGDWGGIIIRNDIDRQEGRFVSEQEGVFPNYVNNATLLYGGGSVRIGSVEQVIDPIHMTLSRPTVSFNTIRLSADAAMSANPDSFEESTYLGQDSFGLNVQEVPFTPDYGRIGPNIHGNHIIDNTVNGLFVRIETPAGQDLERLTVTGRFDDPDVVHIISENLIVDGNPGGSMLDPDGNLLPRFDGSLVIDPGMVVKMDGSRIEVGLSANLLAEGLDGKEVILTSLLDERYGAGGTFDTNQGIDDPADDPAAPGDWGGIYASIVSSISIDHARIAYAGGRTRVEGDFAGFNALELYQAKARVTNSVFEFNDDGLSIAPTGRNGRGQNEQATILVRGSQPIILNNIIRGTQGTETPVISIDANSMLAELQGDSGRSTGLIDRFDAYDDNHGPLVRENQLEDNSLNGMVVRGATLTAESVWDDPDIVHIVYDEIVVPNFRTSGGLRLESSPTQSLVIKLGNNDNLPGPLGIESSRGLSGFVAAGEPSQINDRIGGALHVIGQPGHPVVMTALADDTVGAGFTPSGEPQNDTDNGGRPLPTRPAGSFQLDLNFGPRINEFPDFKRAAELASEIWEELIEDPITVTFDVDLFPLPPTTLANASPEIETFDYDSVRRAIQRDSSGRAHEEIVNQLPGFREVEESVILPDQPFNPFSLSEDVTLTRANALALGFSEGALSSVTSDYDATEIRDGLIRVNEDLGLWDRDRTNGINPVLFDLTGVLIHEIGHSLGFISGVSSVDAALSDAALNRLINMQPLDMFRLEPGAGSVDFTGAPRVLDPSLSQVFYDGGFFNPYGIPIPELRQGDVPLSQGAENGDGAQSSHWKSNALTIAHMGMMNPAGAPGQIIRITDPDRQAFDLIGWDIVGGPIPGDWNGISITPYSHDGNVGVVTELEPSDVESPGENATPSDAQFIGALATNRNSGDETLRLGVTIHGNLNDRADVDVYSFDAQSGTEIWVDIRDRTDTSLDTVVELVNVNGEVLVRSDNSLDERNGDAEILVVPGIEVNPLQKSIFTPLDHFSVNPYDAGFRVVLPGAAGNTNTFHLRVSSANGLSSGVYQMQLRLAEVDEIPGTTVQFAELRYARQAIDVIGGVTHSPFTGETAEDSTDNDFLPIATFPQWRHELAPELKEALGVSNIAGSVANVQTFGSYLDLLRDPLNDIVAPMQPRSIEQPFETQFQNIQNLGDPALTSAGAISLSGSLELTFESEVFVDVDWYSFDITDASKSFIIDADYGDGLNRPDLGIWIFEPVYGGNRYGDQELLSADLIAYSRDGGDVDDLPAPFQGDDLDNLERGSVSSGDPLLGPIELLPGTYYMAVTHDSQIPTDMLQFIDGAPLPDFPYEEDDVRGVLEFHPQPNNPFIRVEPLSSIERVAETNFDDLTDLALNPVPFNLGDVTLYVSTSGQASDILTVDPFTGTQETQVGTVTYPDANNDTDQYGDLYEGDDQFAGTKAIGDIHMHVNHLLYGYSLGDTDANSGNYLRVNTVDAFSIPVVDDTGQGGGGGATAVADDLIVTYEVDPNSDPMMPQPAVSNNGLGEGVQFEAITIIEDPSRDSGYAGYAVGVRGLTTQELGPNANILYTFDVDTGAALSGDDPNREGDDLILDDTAKTDIVERGILFTDSDPRAGDATVLVTTAASALTDGLQVVVQGTGNVYELNTGPMVDVMVDLANDTFVRDGVGFLLDGQRFEFDTGPTISVDVVSGNGLNDGETITIVDNQIQQVSRTFEFDFDDGSGSPPSVQPNHIPVRFDGGFNQAQVTSALIDAINSVAGFEVQATAIGNRISLVNDSPTVEPNSITAGVGIVGANGGTGFLIRTEEFTPLATFGQQVVDGVIAANVGVTAAFDGLRLNFAGAQSMDETEVRGRGVFSFQIGDNNVAAGATEVLFLVTDTSDEIAQKIADQMSAGGDSNTVNGNLVSLTGDAYDRADSPLQVAGAAPGGKITGLEFINGTMYAVSNMGGLFRITGFAGTGAVADYIETSAELLDSTFSGLAKGPANAENGAFATTLFAIESDGTLHAFDTTGARQPVFVDGETSVPTGVSDANGISFSTLDENLWDTTSERSFDDGHNGGDSLRFGRYDSGNQALENRIYDFPGGAYGSVVSDTFDLTGYSSLTQPTLYFNYLLSTDRGQSLHTQGQVDPDGQNPPPPPVPPVDTFRVFVAGDDGQWEILASNAFDFDADGNPVVQLFDSTWEDVPELVPDDPFAGGTTGGGGGGGDGSGLLLRNGIQDPLTDNRQTIQADEIEFSMPSEESIIWRQARIDLSAYAGQENVQLRFDFSTAGSMDVGGTTGVELHAVAGQAISDGDTFVIDGSIFEFELGYALLVPEGAAVADGDTLAIGDGENATVVYEFDKDGDFQYRIILPDVSELADGQMFTVDDGNVIVEMEIDSNGRSTAATVIEIDRATSTPESVASSIADAINDAGLRFTAIGNGPSVEFTGPLEFDSGTSSIAKVVPIAVDGTAPSIDVTTPIVDAINSEGPAGVTARVFGNKIQLEGATSAVLNETSLIVLEGAPGTTEEDNIPVVINREMTSLEVAEVIREAIADEFANGVIETVKIYDDIVKVHEHTVDDPGPLGLTEVLAGDADGAFIDLSGDNARGHHNNRREVITGSDDANFFVPYEGAFVDDLVIGFAGRGEEVTNGRGFVQSISSFEPIPETTNNNQGGQDNPFVEGDDGFLPFGPPIEPVLLPQSRAYFINERPEFVFDPTYTGTGVTTGSYQIELRRGPVLEPLGPSFDVRDRQALSTTIFADPGNVLVDGLTFMISDGNTVVTFEFNNTDIDDGLTDPSHVEVPFTTTDSPAMVAVQIRDAINAAHSDLFVVTASLDDGTVIGPSPGNTNRVSLFGEAVEVISDFLTFEIVEAEDGSSNRVRPQGQLIISSNEILNSQQFGIYVGQDNSRLLPPFGDYIPTAGTGRNLAAQNEESLAPGVVISSNVVSKSRLGGIRYGSDPNGFVIIPPIGGPSPPAGANEVPTSEVWDTGDQVFLGPLQIVVTDNDGLTATFEFDLDGMVTPGAIPIDYNPVDGTTSCPILPGLTCTLGRYHPLEFDMGDAIISAFLSSPLSLDVTRVGTEIYVEGILDIHGDSPWDPLAYIPGLIDWFEPWYAAAQPGISSFGRIVNNTIVGIGGPLTDQDEVRVPGQQDLKLIDDHSDVGLLVADNATPTVLNNVFVNLEVGVASDLSSSGSTVLGASIYQSNLANIDGLNLGEFDIELGANDPLFIDFDSENYYPAPTSRIIDSSIDSLEERPSMARLRDPLDLDLSPVLAPSRDVIGQLRVDDPNVEPPAGFGENVFKDRGALDRADFVGPDVQLVSPRDNDSEGIDNNPDNTFVEIDGTILTEFEFQFVDGLELGDSNGTGVDPATVDGSVIQIRQDDVLLAEGVDYNFSYDATNSLIRLTPVAGIWPNGSEYEIVFVQTIADIAGNTLRANRLTGETRFTISAFEGADYGDAPTPYPTLAANNGAQHTIEPGFFLGGAVTAEADGQPSAIANLDAADDGVTFPSDINPGDTISINVTASDGGRVDAWIDFNLDDDWNDAGEQILVSQVVNPGLNAFSVTIPATATEGGTFARFRLSRNGGLAPTGAAGNGEVEDYALDIGTVSMITGWQNTVNPLDVNNDGFVIARDVLFVVNEINNSTQRDPVTGELPQINGAPPMPPGFVDVNGDGFATAADALAIINFINNGGNSFASGEDGSRNSQNDARQAVLASAITAQHDDVLQALVEPVEVQRNAYVESLQPARRQLADEAFGPVQLDARVDDRWDDIVDDIADDVIGAWGEFDGDWLND